jgi:hypothetical protein
MALEDDYVRATQALIESLRSRADALEKTLREAFTSPPAIPHGVLDGGRLIRKPTTWKTADDIERLLEGGAKTMPRGELVQILADNRLVGGDEADDVRRHQYAEEAIRRGIMYGYLSQNGDGVVHWLPGVRKSRVRKKLLR